MRGLSTSHFSGSMAEEDIMPQLVDDDDNEDEAMPDEKFFSFWQTRVTENLEIEQAEWQDKTFEGLPLTYEDILADEPDPLAVLCKATILKATLNQENGPTVAVTMEKCEEVVESSTVGPGLSQRLHELVPHRFAQTTTPVGRRQLAT